MNTKTEGCFHAKTALCSLTGMFYASISLSQQKVDDYQVIRHCLSTGKRVARRRNINSSIGFPPNGIAGKFF